ncbi:hypothetical protein EWP20_12110 [Neisseria meningitidis]|nr:hypothetical protein [Neisseria meningitidis]CCA44905.1 putative phage associated membrane protein [Neisseria meningitidis alpha522]MBG8594949.1 hypothetical protein [Neisseria meningitidis]MBG8603786.1 hypothetical protein [Neisseria meningitidis]MBG8605994.1 hypothetical protein [Neisseria meningitidis]
MGTHRFPTQQPATQPDTDRNQEKRQNRVSARAASLRSSEMDILLKYWKPVGVLLLIVLIFTAWHFDRAEKYRMGREAAAAEISNRLKDGYIEQAKQARSAEQKAAAAFAERQTKLEEEKQNAEKTVAAMRLELNRLRHYAAAQNRSRNLPATTTAATASDGASDSQGWLLFGQCAEKYAGLAETADGHAADLREWQAYGHAISSQRAE